MNETWRSFLEASGATTADGEVVHFGNPDAETAAAADAESLADLSHLGAVRIEGEDARAFLHAQLTNDVNGLPNTSSALAGYCNPKGRLLAILRVVPRDQGILVILPRALIEQTLRRLAMFVLRARVRLVPAPDLVLIGASGNGVPAALRSADVDVPSAVGGCTLTDELSAIRVPGAQPRFVLIGEPKAMQHYWAALRPAAVPVAGHRWRWMDVLAGLPAIVPETVEKFVPQMVNLDLIDAVSFRKGCYPGQEIVARMHYRSTPKQRMVLMHAEHDARPTAGTPVYARSFGEQAAGHVVNAESAPGGGIDALVTAQLSVLESDTLRLESLSGAALQPRDLPYSLGGRKVSG